MIGTPVDPLAAAAQRSRRRRRLGLGSLLALVVATVGARTVTAGPAHTALAGPLPLAPVSARGQRSGPTAAPVQEPSVPTARTAAPTAGPTALAPAATAPAATAPPVSAARTLTGQPVDVGYGTVQVRVTLAGTRIVGVSALSLPTGGRSDEISSYAEPLLQKEALKAQSASIDAVSGASYTSQGYAQSLQSALDAAK